MTRKKRKRSPAAVPAKKPFRPTFERRVDRTEAFFKRILRMSERALLAHNLKRPYQEDYAAAHLIEGIRDLAAASVGKVRQPTLPL